MKRVLFAVILCACALQLKAQGEIEFMGVPVCGSDTTAYCSALRDRGYTFFGENEKSILYKGLFSGLDASVMLVPFDGSAKVNAVVLTLYNLNPVKMGTLYAELLQKFMRKYQNMKYETATDTTGSTTTTFRNDTGFVALKTEIADMGRTCGISVYYSCNNENTATSDGGGIGIDDI